MKKIIVSLVLVSLLLSLVGCGGGFLSENYGLSEDNITSITKRSSNGKTKDIDASKYGAFMETFDVDYIGCSSSDYSSRDVSYEYWVSYEGSPDRVFVFVLNNGKAVVRRGSDAYVSLYMSEGTIEVPVSLL